LRVIAMRTNIAISPNAKFHIASPPERSLASAPDLPVTLPWRSSLWLYIVPTLWLAGWLLWTAVVSMDTPDRGLVLYALLFIGMPLVLALTGGWWIRQFLHRRTSASLIVTDDYVEWQFEMGSDLDPFADCSRFELIGKRGVDARIEWNLTTSRDDGAGWATKLLRLDWIKSDRTLYGRDVGLDRDGLERLCRLLNQLRDEAAAHR
jgi:hypothetical protein